MTVHVLMVAEKPSIADAVASALSSSKPNKVFRTSNSIPIFEYSGTFRNERATFAVTSTTGHVYSTDFEGRYNNWEGCDPTELFTAPVVSCEANPKTRVVQHLANEAKKADVLILWLDCDREGENICFEVISICQKFFKQTSKQNPRVPANVYRVKFSSLVPQDIRKAFNDQLGLPNANESDAVEARQEIDLKLGVAFTRFLTKYFLNQFGDLDSSLISYGPCQLPTLWFCVHQKEAHDNFVPQTFHTIDVKLSTGTSTLVASWNGGRIFDQSLARTVTSYLRLCEKAVVMKRSSTTKKVTRPLPLNTVNLLKIASSRFGIGPQRAMQVAEHLYLRGLITYPRTETTAYPPAFNAQHALGIISTSGCPVGACADTLLRAGGHLTARRGVDAGDHPPITVCGSAGYHSLNGEEQMIYRLVAEAVVQSLAEDAVYSDESAIFQLMSPENEKVVLPGDHRFTVRETQLLRPGFMFTKETAQGSMTSKLATLEEGAKLQLLSVDLVAGETRPPSLLTESALIGLMEENSIGTDASMATHIQNVLNRNYVALTGTNRTLTPTKLGMTLCKGLEQIDPELTRPIVRSMVERECNRIAQGKASKKDVVAHVLGEFAIKFQFLLRSIDSLQNLFELSFTSISQSGSPFSRCGQCKRYLSHVRKKPQRLLCSRCSIVMKLPMLATVRTIGDFKCPFDDYEIVLAIERNGKAYTFCPYCYTNPPFPNLAGAMKCIDCPVNVRMKGSRGENMVGMCYKDNCNGVLYLQSSEFSGVMKALACSKCDLLEPLSEDKVSKTAKLSPAKECDKCGWYQVSVQVKEPSTTLSGCLGCDNDLLALFADQSERGFKHKKKKHFNKRRPHVDPKLTFDRF